MEENKKLTCGLIMPISSIDGCTEQHWSEVKDILASAVSSIESYEFQVNLVSDSDDIGVIQKRIVQNVYSSDIVICDVSAKNPNVMFELGLRLAFDKPTIIIKDDKTNYSFDTSVIEHLEYPRDLRFGSIVAFKEKVAKKLLATYEESIKNPEHSIFLKNFGKFTVAKLNETEVTVDNAILDILGELQHDVSILRRNNNKRNNSNPSSIIENAEVVLNLKRGINLYMDSEQINHPLEVKKRDDLYRFLEEHINAQKVFNGPTEFEKFVDRIINSWP
jgi:hypothetical protein